MGGETASLLRLALDDIDEFIKNAEVRKTYREKRYRRLLTTIKGLDIPQKFSDIAPSLATASDCKEFANFLDGQLGTGAQVAFPMLAYNWPQHLSRPEKFEYTPWNEDLDWLTEEFQSLMQLYDRLKQLHDEYAYGVLYAVKFSPKDIECMNYAGGNGIEYWGKVSSAQIVAKALISNPQPRLSTDVSLISLKSGGGVLRHLLEVDKR